MIYTVVLTFSMGILVALGQIYPPPVDESETPEVSGTAVPLLVTTIPIVATPYPAQTPGAPAGEIEESPEIDTAAPRLIGSDNQPGGSSQGQTAEATAARPDTSDSLTFLWLAFLAALMLFLAGVAGSTLLFARRSTDQKQSH
jgi:hypothetical protein